MTQEERIYSALEETFANDKISVTDYVGDQNHFTIAVESAQFSGVSRIQQQRMIFKALGDLAKEIHAFQFELSTPKV